MTVTERNAECVSNDSHWQNIIQDVAVMTVTERNAEYASNT